MSIIQTESLTDTEPGTSSPTYPLSPSISGPAGRFSSIVFQWLAIEQNRPRKNTIDQLSKAQTTRNVRQFWLQIEQLSKSQTLAQTKSPSISRRASRLVCFPWSFVIIFVSCIYLIRKTQTAQYQSAHELPKIEEAFIQEEKREQEHVDAPNSPVSTEPKSTINDVLPAPLNKSNSAEVLPIITPQELTPLRKL